MTIKQFEELQRLQRVLGLGEGDLLKLAHVEGVTFTCCSRNVSDLTSDEIGAVIAKAQQLERQYQDSKNKAMEALYAIE